MGGSFRISPCLIWTLSPSIIWHLARSAPSINANILKMHDMYHLRSNPLIPQGDVRIFLLQIGGDDYFDKWEEWFWFKTSPTYMFYKKCILNEKQLNVWQQSMDLKRRFSVKIPIHGRDILINVFRIEWEIVSWNPHSLNQNTPTRICWYQRLI